MTYAKPLLITAGVVGLVVAAGAIGVGVASTWSANRTVDSYAVSYVLSGLKGTETISYGDAPDGKRTGEIRTVSAKPATGTTTIDAIVGAGRTAFVTVEGMDVAGVGCELLNDRETQYPSTLTPQIERGEKRLTCSLTMKTGEKVMK